MATFAKENDSDVVSRGKFIREMLLCQPLPPPPANVNAVPPPPDGKTTQRQRINQHSADPTCAGCHSLMDPLGFAFERYDGVGKYRTTDVGQMLDTSGKLTGAEPEGAAFKGGRADGPAGQEPGEEVLHRDRLPLRPRGAGPPPGRLHPAAPGRALQRQRRRHDRPGGGHDHRRVFQRAGNP